tara:strand:+ start:1612 stop:1791 length:180 start_codon:yes stop_codon:yes gene_type:complete
MSADQTTNRGKYRIIFSPKTHLYHGICKTHGLLFAGVAVRRDAHAEMAAHINGEHKSQP